MQKENYLTFTYKRIGNLDIKFDIYLPDHVKPKSKLAAVVSFHGGGLVVGNRRSWFPTWLQREIY